MSEPNEPVAAQEPTTTEAGTDSQTEPGSTPSDGDGATGDVFPRDYVEKLRAEAAEHRVKAARADDLVARLLVSVKQTAAGDLLRDVGDLPDAAEFFDADGLPDPSAIRSAAEELLRSKPWLARPRGGEMFQGARPEVEAVSLGALLREAAR